jgi:hypothetical protein
MKTRIKVAIVGAGLAAALIVPAAANAGFFLPRH